MRRQEQTVQILQDACEEVESSCASCGEFGSQLVTVDENWLRSTEAKLEVWTSAVSRMAYISSVALVSTL